MEQQESGISLNRDQGEKADIVERCSTPWLSTNTIKKEDMDYICFYWPRNMGSYDKENAYNQLEGKM